MFENTDFFIISMSFSGYTTQQKWFFMLSSNRLYQKQDSETICVENIVPAALVQ